MGDEDSLCVEIVTTVTLGIETESLLDEKYVNYISIVICAVLEKNDIYISQHDVFDRLDPHVTWNEIASNICKKTRRL